MNNLKLSILVIMTAIFIVSCQKEGELVNPEISRDDAILQIPTGMTELGEQLENPYSVENMKKALQALQDDNQLKSATTEDFEVEATHLYVRFLPDSEEQLEVLKQDTLLDLFDYPLDYEIAISGSYYHDPSLPDSSITWQYTVVAPDYVFSEIEYEILAELFIMEDDDEDELIDLKSAVVSVSDWEALEDKALEITGNLEEAEEGEIQLKGWFSRRSKWRPAGSITANGRNVVGCMVRARRWFTIHKGYTNNNGEFSCNGRFRRPANYSIKWERHYWSIRSGTWGQAYYNGSKKKGDWNLNITGGKSLRYAFIHQAAYDYFYRNPFNTQIPFKKKWYRSDLKIGYYDKLGEDKRGDHAKWRNWFTWPHLRIYKGQSSTASTTDIYATTIHELAHSAHLQKIISASGSNRISDFYNADKKLKESWAVGMQTLFTRHFISSNYDRYGNVSVYNRNTNYSEIVLELMEDASYTASELESCLVEASNLSEWQTNINNKYKRNETILETIFSWY